MAAVHAVQVQTGWLLRQRHLPERDTVVRPWLKYLVFAFNIFLWVIGMVLIIAGTWAESQKETMNKIAGVSDVVFDPAALFIVFGIITFIVGFTGCVGALRENTHVLLYYIIAISIMLAFILIGALVGYLMRDHAVTTVRKKILEFIADYRDDIDKQNMIDWIQRDFLQCCGADSPSDWDANEYFRCGATTREQCGVPFSCCVPVPGQLHDNFQCGYDTRTAPTLGEQTENLQSGEIYESGCLDAALEFFKKNLLPVLCAIAVIVVIMVFMLVIVCLLRNEILDQKKRWLIRRATIMERRATLMQRRATLMERRKSHAASVMPEPESEPETEEQPPAEKPADG